MKRSLRSGLSLASVAFSLALVGCGGGGVDSGMPEDPKRVDHPLDPKMVDPTGNMGPGVAAKAAKEAAAAQQKAQSATPTGGAPAAKP